MCPLSVVGGELDVNCWELGTGSGAGAGRAVFVLCWSLWWLPCCL